MTEKSTERKSELESVCGWQGKDDHQPWKGDDNHVYEPLKPDGSVKKAHGSTQ